MEHVARLDLEPANVGVGPVAGHHTKACPGVAVELERHPGGECAEVEADRQVHEDDVVLRDLEVVHHHHVGDFDALKLLQLAVGAHTDVVQVRRAHVEVAEREELAGDRAHLRVRCHRAGESAAVVLHAKRVQLVIDAPRPVPFLQAKNLSVVRQHVSVAGASGEVAHAGHRVLERVGDVGGLYEPVAIPLGLAVREADAVDHAVTEEPVVGLATRGVRPGADVGAKQFGWNRPVNAQFHRGHFVEHRCPVVAKVPLGCVLDGGHVGAPCRWVGVSFGRSVYE